MDNANWALQVLQGDGKNVSDVIKALALFEREYMFDKYKDDLCEIFVEFGLQNYEQWQGGVFDLGVKNKAFSKLTGYKNVFDYMLRKNHKEGGE